MNVTDALLEQKGHINERTMKTVFNELVEQEYYPVVLLRIVVNAYRNFPVLKSDALHVLERLGKSPISPNV